MKIKLFNVSMLAAVCFAASSQAAVTADKLYNQYKEKSNNKAYAIGTNGVAGAAWGAPSKEEAMNLAQDTCNSSGGLNCNITEVNGRPLSSNDTQVKNYKTVNNYNVVSNGVSYKPDLRISTTGFFINNEYLLTTSYVVENCSKINYERNGRLIEATVIRTDRMNSISILKSSVPNDTYAIISSKKKTAQGERTYTYGFDLSDMGNSKIPSYQGKITDGIISRVSGKYNDVRFMTITNEINTGNVVNLGGPVISENGDVIGLVRNADKESIKASMLSIFLNEQNISYHVSKSKSNVSPSDIAANSQKFAVPLVCLNEA